MDACECRLLFNIKSENDNVLVGLRRDLNLTRPCVGDIILGWRVSRVEHDLESGRLDVTIQDELPHDHAVSVIQKFLDNGFRVVSTYTKEGYDFAWVKELEDMIRKR